MRHPRFELGIVAITEFFLDTLYQLCMYNAKQFAALVIAEIFGAFKRNTVATSVVEQLLTWSRKI